MGDLNFRFSGLKTSILYFVQKRTKENPEFIQENLQDICASIQHTIIKILMDKLKMAVKQSGINRVAIAGGVSANSGIRRALQEAEGKYQWEVFLPKFEYTTDNAAMIAIAGYYKFLEKDFADMGTTAKARIRM